MSRPRRQQCALSHSGGPAPAVIQQNLLTSTTAQPNELGHAASSMLFKAPEPDSSATVSAQRLGRPAIASGIESSHPPVHTSGGSGLRLLIVNYEFPPIGGGASFACLGLARTL